MSKVMISRISQAVPVPYILLVNRRQLFMIYQFHET